MLELEYKFLKGADVAALMPALKQAGFVAPYQHLAEPLAAFLGEEIIAFGVNQLLPHLEPVWIKPEYRGLGIGEEIAKRLKERLLETNCDFFCCIAETPASEEIARRIGMTEVKGKLFVWRKKE